MATIRWIARLVIPLGLLMLLDVPMSFVASKHPTIIVFFSWWLVHLGLEPMVMRSSDFNRATYGRLIGGILPVATWTGVLFATYGVHSALKLESVFNSTSYVGAHLLYLALVLSFTSWFRQRRRGEGSVPLTSGASVNLETAIKNALGHEHSQAQLDDHDAVSLGEDLGLSQQAINQALLEAKHGQAMNSHPPPQRRMTSSSAKKKEA